MQVPIWRSLRGRSCFLLPVKLKPKGSVCQRMTIRGKGKRRAVSPRASRDGDRAKLSAHVPLEQSSRLPLSYFAYHAHAHALRPVTA